ncbi:MAG: DUF3990 domain-containing protein [Chitinispirillales bacterium]|jgi:hypothetical protein|nr:DUF3990 domain-containing protein [Chitinispirillales bacterium]
MILYHGSNVEIKCIDLTKCRLFKDFGKGFYLTDIKEQAERMAIRTAKQYGGSPKVTPFVFNEEIFQDKNVKIKRFENPCHEWAYFVMNNRNRNFKDIANPLTNYDSKYDVVIGCVANDDLSVTFNLFLQGYIDIDIMVKRLEFKELTSQYSFHTENAIKYLDVTGVQNDR